MQEIKVNRKIELNKQFKISRMKEVIKPTIPHKHDGYYELIFLNDGAGIHSIDENDYVVKPPLLFYMDPGHVHCWEFSKIPKGYVCIFKEEFITEFPDIMLKISDLGTCYYIQWKDIDFEKDFLAMFEEYKRDEPDLNVLKHYLNVILWKITRLKINSHENHNENNPLLNNYRKLIEQYYIQNKTLDFYAEQLKISKRILSNVCKKETGRTALSLINERLIVESKRLLKHTPNSISEIAYHLNFNDPSHFVKFFRSKTNLTPGEFRAKIK